MKYYCEDCGKIYDTENEVMACEAKHREAKKIAEEKETQKEKRWDEVCVAKKRYDELYAEYVHDYGTRVKRVKYYPPLDLFSEIL